MRGRLANNAWHFLEHIVDSIGQEEIRKGGAAFFCTQMNSAPKVCLSSLVLQPDASARWESHEKVLNVRYRCLVGELLCGLKGKRNEKQQFWGVLLFSDTPSQSVWSLLEQKPSKLCFDGTYAQQERLTFFSKLVLSSFYLHFVCLFLYVCSSMEGI